MNFLNIITTIKRFKARTKSLLAITNKDRQTVEFQYTFDRQGTDYTFVATTNATVFFDTRVLVDLKSLKINKNTIIEVSETFFKVDGVPTPFAPTDLSYCLPDKSLFSLRTAPDILANLSLVSTSCSIDVTRSILTKVLIDTQYDNLAATNGHHLSWFGQGAVNLQDRHLDGHVAAALGNTKIYKNMQISTAPVEGYHLYSLGDSCCLYTSARYPEFFPNYIALIPDYFKNEFTLPIGLVYDLKKLTDQSVTLSIKGQKLITLSAGDFASNYEINLIGDVVATTLSFNRKYLLSLVKSCTGDIVLSFNEKLSPIVIKSDNKVKHLLMPIRLR